jgi:peptide/nickel transport system substrate-binding protein
MDYHNGDADSIAGLVLSNDNRTLTMHFETMNPSMIYAGGFWSTPVPRHVFEGIPVADMPNSEPVLVNPVGWGPFKVQSVVPGESVHMVRNDNYVWGTPLIEGLIVERIPTELIPTAMESGRFDYVEFPAIYYGDYSNPSNYRYVGSPDPGYQYVSFRLGHWDFDNNINVFAPDRDMNNVYLRRAMAHAIDQNELGDVLYNGLHFAAGSFMPPNHRALMDLTLPGFPYDPAKAREILAEGGFVDIDGDGYVEWPNGEPLTVIWAASTDPATEDIIIPFHIQSWADIGVRVELWQGRTHDIFYLWDTLDFDTDDDEIHIYMARWTSIGNPNPSGRWGHEMWNPSRYNSPEWEAILDALVAPDVWDPARMREVYGNMQRHLYETVPYFPTRWIIRIYGINNRVTNWDTRTLSGLYPDNITPRDHGWHTIGLSAAEPLR